MSALPSNVNALFVYYRVPCDRVAEAQDHVSAMQWRLQQDWPGLSCRLMARREERERTSDAQTWMEVYEHPQGLSAAFMAHLYQRLQALPVGLIGTRHNEWFNDMPPASGINATGR